jgi:NADP-dependent 3-hydroxy acid dehydrogenase YdfG
MILFAQSQTDDIKINIVINNAGYMVTGLFADTDLDKIMCNYECNATSAMKITHHFLNKILDSGKKGLIAFTAVRTQNKFNVDVAKQNTISLACKKHKTRDAFRRVYAFGAFTCHVCIQMLSVIC